MSEILFQYYKVNPTTWVYLSSLLMIGLYFKFGRFWSVRNLDLMLLILLAPGLLMAQYGGEARVKALRLSWLEAQEARRARAEALGAIPEPPLVSPPSVVPPLPGATATTGPSAPPGTAAGPPPLVAATPDKAPGAASGAALRSQPRPAGTGR